MTQKEFCDNLLEIRPKLLRRAYCLTKNRDDAEDLVQDVSFRALKYFPRITDFSQINAWFFTVLQNTFINEYRRKSKANTFIDVTPDLFHINLTEEKGYISPESAYQEKEILNIIGLLDIKRQKPFQMHVEGFKYEEIAKELNTNIGTIKSRIFLARKELMNIINNPKKITAMNEIAKTNVKQKLEIAMHKETLTAVSVAAVLGTKAEYISLIKNPKLWDKCPPAAWDIILGWVNSGQPLVEYGKKYGRFQEEPVKKVEEVKPVEKKPEIKKEPEKPIVEPQIKIKPGVLEKRQEEIAKKERRASRGEMVDMLLEEKETLRAKIEAIDTLLKHYIS